MLKCVILINGGVLPGSWGNFVHPTWKKAKKLNKIKPNKVKVA